MPHSEPDLSDSGQRHGALFAGLVIQQVNMALMFLGRLPGPEGQTVPRDLNAAGVFVDTLEMLEAKTRGNLSKDEAALLQQSLMSARMSFAQAVQSEPAPTPPPDAAAPPAAADPAGAAEPAADSTAAADPDAEGKVRFTKKY